LVFLDNFNLRKTTAIEKGKGKRKRKRQRKGKREKERDAGKTDKG